DEAVATRSRARPPRLDEALEALPDHCIELLLGEYDLELGEERSVLLVGVEIAHLPASTATIASMADRSSAGRRVDDSLVAEAIAGSGRVGTIALQECDRRAAGALRRSRTAEFGRMRR